MFTKGDRINDRYEIIKLIGEGGMANVYLALDENLEIMQIAEQVGYRNYSNFYKAFKKATGTSPEEYRRQLPGISSQ